MIRLFRVVALLGLGLLARRVPALRHLFPIVSRAAVYAVIALLALFILPARIFFGVSCLLESGC